MRKWTILIRPRVEKLQTGYSSFTTDRYFIITVCHLPRKCPLKRRNLISKMDDCLKSNVNAIERDTDRTTRWYILFPIFHDYDRNRAIGYRGIYIYIYISRRWFRTGLSLSSCTRVKLWWIVLAQVDKRGHLVSSIQRGHTRARLWFAGDLSTGRCLQSFKRGIYIIHSPRGGMTHNGEREHCKVGCAAGERFAIKAARYA